MIPQQRTNYIHEIRTQNGVTVIDLRPLPPPTLPPDQAAAMEAERARQLAALEVTAA